MHNPPEDIIQYKRNRTLYKEHLKRVRGQHALIDSSIPKSLGLKHLQTRAKKKQLMEDRSQLVAKDNKLLMERMTAIMTADNPQKKHVHGSSLNERERKLHVQKINKTNELMLSRLGDIKPILNVKKFATDFERHKKIGGYLKKKRYGPATLKPLSTQPKFGASVNSTFDAESYISHFGPESEKQSPITSMAEFRKAVISSKRMGSTGGSVAGAGATMRSSSQGNLQGKTDGGESPKKEIRFEMTHEPS